MADEDGYVFASNVNPMEEMANMISASRSFQQNVEVMNTSKELLLRTFASANKAITRSSCLPTRRNES